MEKVVLPAFPVSGGCQCGAVRYRLNAAPLTFYLCHCTECQKQSSSAFGESLRVNAGDMEARGVLKSFTRPAGSGSDLECQFCPCCGTRLFHRRRDYGAQLNIKAGSLDETGWLEPAGHIWTGSKQPHVIIPSGVLRYEGQPGSYDALAARWQEMTRS